MAASVLAMAAVAAAPAHAASVVGRFCGATPSLSAGQHDRLLRVAARVRAELDASGAPVALIARAGLDLSRFQLRYSHAGLALADPAEGHWAVRQLYYACDEARPRLFDQGLAGFVAGAHDPQAGFLSLVMLPDDAARQLADAARDRARALRLLADDYSANAYPWSLRYQNCNQWVAEVLAVADGRLDDGADLRARAQAWLRAAAYRPALVDVGSHAVKFAAGFVPWIQLDDRPEDERLGLTMTVSVPQSLEAFLRQRWPDARRVEICHDDRHIVVRRGWQGFGTACDAAPGDDVVAW